MTHTKKTLLALSLAAAVLASGAASAFAQSATLTCVPVSSVVAPGTNASFLLSGGNGTFSIAGTGVLTGTTTSTVVTGNFPTTGNQSFTVTSGGQTANCNVVVAAASANALTCVNPTGNFLVGQNVTFSATGGTGATLTWSASDLQISNPTGTSFTANYATPGIHTVTVTGGGQSASCAINIGPTASTGNPTDVICAPAAQNAMVGQQVNFSATGGNGSYVWSATDLQIANPTGSGFRASYATPGLHTIMVASAGRTGTCTVNVTAASLPGLPNTGFAPVN